MNAAIPYQLQAEARRYGFDDPEPVFALHSLAEWAAGSGYRITGESAIIAPSRTRPVGRALVFAADRYAYLVQLMSEPLHLFLKARASEHSMAFYVGFWVDGLTEGSWEALKGKVLAMESGKPKPLRAG